MIKYRPHVIANRQQAIKQSQEIATPRRDVGARNDAEATDLRYQLLAELKRELFQELKSKITGVVGALAVAAIFSGIGILAFMTPPSRYTELTFDERKISSVRKIISPDLTEGLHYAESFLANVKSSFDSTLSQITITQSENQESRIPVPEQVRYGAGKNQGIAERTKLSIDEGKLSSVRSNIVTQVIERRKQVIPADLASLKSSLLEDVSSLNQAIKTELF